MVRVPVCVTVLEPGVYVNVLAAYTKELKITLPDPLIVSGTENWLPPVSVMVLPAIGARRKVVVPPIEVG
jgi:hypothetical protein